MDDVIAQCPLRTRDNAEKAALILKNQPLDLLVSRVKGANPAIATIPYTYATSALFAAGDPRGPEFAHELLSCINWTEAFLVSEAISVVLRHIGAMPTSMDFIKRILLSEAMRTYPSNEGCLSLLHVLYVQYNYPRVVPTPLCDDIDQRLPPASLVEIRRYFYLGALMLAELHDWEKAVIFAGIALSVCEPIDSGGDVSQPSRMQCYRLVVVLELIAHFRYEPVPISVFEASSSSAASTSSSQHTCSLIQGLAQHFGKWDAATAAAIREYAANNEPRFRQFGLWSLVKRCIVAYRIAWLQDLHRVLRRVKWSELMSTGPETLDELLSAGYHVDVVETDEGVLVEARPAATAIDNKDFSRVLMLSRRLTGS